MLRSQFEKILLLLVTIMGSLFLYCCSYADVIVPIEREHGTPDVWTSASSWAIEELNNAKDNNLIPNSFNGVDFTKNVTREEFAEISVLLYEELNNCEITYKNAIPFEDTSNLSVAKAYSMGITSGTSETTFLPDKEITREEMATMISRTLQKSGVDTKRYDPTARVEFKDHNLMHDWSEDAIYFMADREIIKGIGNGLYGVNEKATREQALIISQRCFDTFKGTTTVPQSDVTTEVETPAEVSSITVTTTTPTNESSSAVNSIALQAFNGKFERYIGEGKRQTVAYQLCDLITTNNASNNGQPITIEFIDLDGGSKEVSDVASIHEITSTIIKANNVKYDITGSYDNTGYLYKVTYKSFK